MDRYVVSRELAEKLKAAGYPQTTVYRWWHDLELKGWKVREFDAKYDSGESDWWPYAAPLSDELLEQLPANVDVLKVRDSPEYYVYFPKGHGINQEFTADKPADALAELWLWCKENGYIK